MGEMPVATPGCRRTSRPRGADPDRSGEPDHGRGGAPGPVVVLYGHACCPGTRRAREYLSDRGIAYEEHVVGEPWVEAVMLRWQAWATPLLVVADRWSMVGFDACEFERLLRRAREVSRHERR